MNATFGTMLRKKRLEERWTTLKFAELTGISASILSQLESDTRTPTPKTLDIILGHLDFSETEAKELLTLADETKKRNGQHPLLFDAMNMEGNRASIALRVAKEMDFDDKEWAELYHSLPSNKKREDEQ